MLGPLVGPHSTLLLDGAEHLRHRKLLLPPFHGERMREYGELMARGRRAARVGVAEGRAVLGDRLDAGDHARGDPARGLRDRGRPTGSTTSARLLRAVLDPMSNRWQMLTLMLAPSSWGPRSPWGRFRQRVREADEAIYEEIRARRADPAAAERGDVMSLLLQARDEDGEPLSDQELRDELVTLLVAGHETTATSLAWTLERITRHPEVLAQLEDDPDGEYLDAVIKESLRLRPVVPAVGRMLAEPVELGGYELPAGVSIVPSIYLTHRRPDIYPDPLAFKPERFIENPPSNYEYLPFGGGVRRCLGASFAQFEMKVVLGTILRHARVSAPQSRAEKVTRRSITFAPSSGGRIVARAA